MHSYIKTDEEKLNLEAYLKALLVSKNESEIIKSLSNLNVVSPYRIRMKILYSPDPSKTIFEELETQGTIKKINTDATVYSYESTIGKDIPRKINVFFIIISFQKYNINQAVHALVSICQIDQWRSIQKLIRKNYPKIVPILLSQSELFNCAKKLQTITGHEVHVKSFSGKERAPYPNEKRKRSGDYRGSLRKWMDDELDNVLYSIKERDQRVKSLDLEFYSKIGSVSYIRPCSICKIRKDGEIEVSGDLQIAFNSVAVEIAKVGEKKLQFLSKRGLRESKYESKPLSIDYPQDIFNDVKVVQDFVSLLSKYPHSMYSIAHGNPYAQLKITDSYDGSSFDVWAVPPRKITLIPGFKATEAAFERLVQYIFDSFNEGQILDYDQS